MTVTPEIFKQCLGCFATGVTVITVLDSKGKPHGITINAFASLSLEPPLILFNIAKTATCHKILLQAKHFSVNILAEGQQQISQLFAFAKDDKWQKVASVPGKNKCPILDGIIAYLECDFAFSYDGGDHTIIVGKVTHLEKQSEKKPLLYYRGEYSNVSEI